MILKKWKKGYFLQDGNVNETDNYLALQSAIPSRELELLSKKSSSKATKTMDQKGKESYYAYYFCFVWRSYDSDFSACSTVALRLKRNTGIIDDFSFFFS
jgi:hypothetical protein